MSSQAPWAKRTSRMTSKLTRKAQLNHQSRTCKHKTKQKGHAHKQATALPSPPSRGPGTARSPPPLAHCASPPRPRAPQTQRAARTRRRAARRSRRTTRACRRCTPVRRRMARRGSHHRRMRRVCLCFKSSVSTRCGWAERRGSGRAYSYDPRKIFPNETGGGGD